MIKSKTFKRLYKDYTSKFLGKILLAAVFSVLVALSTSATAWLLDPAIEKIFINKDQTLIILIPVAIIIAFSAKGISLYFAKLIMINVSEEVKKIFDPEIPVNIYDLGLIYKIEVDEKNKVKVDMTLTSPNCPVAESLPNQVKENIMKIEGVSDVDLKLVWEPPWDKDKMTEAAKLELNL